MKRILIISPIDSSAINLLLETNFFQIDDISKENIPLNKIFKILHKYHILILRSKIRIDDNFISKCKKLEMIAKPSIGLDNINIKLTHQNNIKILNATQSNIKPTAEFIIMLILMYCKGLLNTQYNINNTQDQNNKYLFNFHHKIPRYNLENKKIGIIGFGNIGKEVYKKLISFNVKIKVNDPYIKGNDKDLLNNISVVKLEEILKWSDIITITCSLNKTSKNLINNNNMNYLKKGITIINCARKDILNDSLVKELVNKKIIHQYIVDDFIDNNPNIINTHHIAGKTINSFQNGSIEICCKIIEYYKNLIEK